MEEEKNLHEIFEEIEKETPPKNKWKKIRKGDGTYQTFGMIYGAVYGILAGFIVGILLDKTSLSMLVGMLIGLVVGRTIGYGYKKRKKDEPTEEELLAREEINDDNRKL